MSESPGTVAVARRFSEAMVAGDLDGALAAADTAIELRTRCEVLRGAAGLRRLAAGPKLDHLAATIGEIR